MNNFILNCGFTSLPYNGNKVSARMEFNEAIGIEDNFHGFIEFDVINV